MDVFGLKDQLQMIGHAEGISPGPDARQQAFLDAIKKSQQAQGAGQMAAGMMPAVATADPAIAVPSPAVQAVANAMPSPQIGGTPMQPMPMMGGFSGVQLPRFR